MVNVVVAVVPEPEDGDPPVKVQLIDAPTGDAVAVNVTGTPLHGVGFETLTDTVGIPITVTG